MAGLARLSPREISEPGREAPALCSENLLGGAPAASPGCRGCSSLSQQGSGPGVPTGAVCFSPSHLFIAQLPSPSAASTPVHWLCFHLCGTGAGFSYCSMQVLPPSVTPGPADLSQYKLGICSFTALTRDINLCFLNPWPWRPPWKSLGEDFPGLYPSLITLNGFYFGIICIF